MTIEDKEAKRKRLLEQCEQTSQEIDKNILGAGVRYYQALNNLRDEDEKDKATEENNT